jgi:hypothetical protein
VDLSTFLPKASIQHFQRFTHYLSLPAYLRSFGTAVCVPFFSNFFCSSLRGSSKGRGTRAATWFTEYLKDHGNKDIQSLVLAEGIKGWVGAGPEYTDLMLEFNIKAWEKS